MRTQINNFSKTLIPQVILVVAALFVALLVVTFGHSYVSAQGAGLENATRLQLCNVPGLNAQQKQECLDNLDREAFNACVNNPNPGQCAESYKNSVANASSSSKNNSSNQAPTPITSAEREQLANCDGSQDPQKCLEGNPLVRWTLFAINVLAAGVGVVVTIMIIVGGIQYAAAGPNPQAVQSAKKKIANAIIALVAFFFLFAFLQWLVPGGVF